MNGVHDPSGNSPSERGADGGGENGGSQGAGVERVRQALAALATGTGSRAELEHAARALVSDLRRRHEPPERVLVQIKELLAAAGLHASGQAPGERGLPEHPPSLYRDVIALSIRCYYEDETAGDGAS